MKIHEYQARSIYRDGGIPVPPETMVKTEAEAVSAAESYGYPVVVKAQVHAGGRGKAGGVKLVNNDTELKEAVRSIMGMRIKHSTVTKLMVTPCSDIAQEIYLGITLDRARQLPVMMACGEGGVEIEDLAVSSPEKIFKVYPLPLIGLQPSQARQVGFFLSEKKSVAFHIAKIATQLAEVFLTRDCSLAEINPLVITPDDRVLALDAKINFDDNAAGRHPEYEALRDMAEEEPLEIEAGEADLSFVQLDGDVGIIGNGAGLVMTTLDVVTEKGGSPANFLDIGGSSSPEKVKTAFEITLRNKNVKSVLVNVFGGITRCDDVANGMIAAIGEIGETVPVVIRLIGTNQEKGLEILNASDLKLTGARSMEEGAEKAVALAKQACGERG